MQPNHTPGRTVASLELELTLPYPRTLAQLNPHLSSREVFILQCAADVVASQNAAERHEATVGKREREHQAAMAALYGSHQPALVMPVDVVIAEAAA